MMGQLMQPQASAESDPVATFASMKARLAEAAAEAALAEAERDKLALLAGLADPSVAAVDAAVEDVTERLAQLQELQAAAREAARLAGHHAALAEQFEQRRQAVLALVGGAA